MKILKNFHHIIETNTRLIPIVGVILLAIAVPITLQVIEQNQDNRQQASGPISTLNTPVGTTPMSCEEMGGTCEIEDPNNPEFSCFGVIKDGSDSRCSNAAHVCCIKKNPTVENSTCIDAGKSCEYGTISECENVAGIGNCKVDPDNTCVNTKLCIEIGSSAGPAFPARGEPCPDGSTNFSCGFGTSDTQCPVCSSNSTCSSNNYSIASCSSGSACTADADCAGRPSSCPAGTTGVVSCVQNICQTVNCQ
jgi:hypothetical protein